jgi:hypothetical protein
MLGFSSPMQSVWRTVSVPALLIVKQRGLQKNLEIDG